MVDSKVEISVVLAVRDGQEFLRDCILSVIGQTFQNWEFIIVDDNSSDNSINIINEYVSKDKRIKLIQVKPTMGQTYCLNLGVENSNGNLIARIDADDIMLPNRLETQRNFLINNPKCGVVYSRVEFINHLGESIGESKNFCDENLISFFGKRNIIIHSSVLMRKEILKMVNYYNNKYKYAQDYDLWLKMIAYCEIRILPMILTKYRIHQKSISVTNEKKQIKESIIITVNYFRSGTLKISNIFNLWKKIIIYFIPNPVLKYLRYNNLILL